MTAINSKSNVPFNQVTNKPLDEAMLDNDPLFTANSATLIPTQQAVASAIGTISETIDNVVTTNTDQSIESKKTFVSSTTNAGLALSGETPIEPVNGDIWVSSRGSIHCRIRGLTVQLVSLMYAQTKVLTVANTDVETSLIDTEGSVGTNVVPSNFLLAGRVIRIRAVGIYRSPIEGTQSLRFRFKINGATAMSASFGLPVNQANSQWKIELDMGVVQAGNNGAVLTSGDLQMENRTNSYPFLGRLTSVSPIPFDTTVPNVLDITADWVNALPENFVSVSSITMEVLN